MSAIVFGNKFLTYFPHDCNNSLLVGKDEVTLRKPAESVLHIMSPTQNKRSFFTQNQSRHAESTATGKVSRK